MSFGEVLTRIRKNNADSLRTLGAKMGVSYGYINQIENSIRPVNEDFLKKNY